jgi:hypothetical protein
MQVCFEEVEVFPSLIQNVCFVSFMQVCFGEVEVFPSLIQNVCFVGFMQVCFEEVGISQSPVPLARIHSTQLKIAMIGFMQRSRLLEIIVIGENMRQ